MTYWEFNVPSLLNINTLSQTVFRTVLGAGVIIHLLEMSSHRKKRWVGRPGSRMQEAAKPRIKPRRKHAVAELHQQTTLHGESLHLKRLLVRKASNAGTTWRGPFGGREYSECVWGPRNPSLVPPALWGGEGGPLGAGHFSHPRPFQQHKHPPPSGCTEQRFKQLATPSQKDQAKGPLSPSGPKAHTGPCRDNTASKRFEPLRGSFRLRVTHGWGLSRVGGHLEAEVPAPTHQTALVCEMLEAGKALHHGKQVNDNSLLRLAPFKLSCFRNSLLNGTHCSGHLLK